MLTDGIEQILFCAPCAARSLSHNELAFAFAPCMGPPLPWHSPRPSFSTAPAVHPTCSAPRWPAGFSVLRAVCPSWQHHRGCPALSEQWLREGKWPQTINYSLAPLHTHTNAVEICAHTHTCTHAHSSWKGGHMGCPAMLSPLVPGHPPELWHTPETGF